MNMKNPLEYSMLEIEAMMRTDADAPQFEFTRLLKYVHDRQTYLAEYQVQKTAELIKRSVAALPRCRVRNLDQELLDAAEIVTEVIEAGNSQDPTAGQ
jgi:hypothetical protein